MDLNSWRTAAHANLARLAGSLRRLAPETLYGALSAATLLPVITASQQAMVQGDMATLLAIGNLLGSLGVNLVSNQIQAWRNRSQDELAAEIEDRVAAEPALRDELAQVLEKLDAVPVINNHLADADRDWLRETLRRELARLGNSARYEALLVGTGAIAQGTGAKAGGAGSVVADTIAAPVTVTTVAPGGHAEWHYHAGPKEPASPRPRYLERLRRECATLPLAALGGEEGTEADPTLDQVYIELDTRTQVPLTEAEKAERQRRPETMPGRETDSRPLTAIEAASQARRLVLLGDPGAGKSTFVRKLAGWLAAANASLAVEPPPGFDRQLLPVVIVLRDLVAGLGSVQLNNLSAAKRQKKLADLVRDQALADLDAMECSDFATELRQAFYDGKCLLILDGLDEVPYDLRPLVRETVTAVLALHRPQRTIVTCRVRSYTAGWTLPGFQEHTLAPLDNTKIRWFATAWYNAQKDLGRVTAGQAEQRAADLAEKALGADLRELAENPMLLTTMAIIHQKEIGLPRERVRLYNLAVDVLLRRWQKRKVGGALVPSPGLASFLQNELHLRQAVERLAYEALKVKRGEAADLPRGEVLALLETAEYLGSAGLAHEFLDYVDQRAGLLVGRGGEEGKPAHYSFPHRTFQEYLAGCYLIRLRGVERVYYAHAAEGDYYGLAARLGAEEMWYNGKNPNGLLDLAYHLCSAQAPRSTQERRALLWSGYMAALAGRAVIERDTGGPDVGEAYLERLVPRLEALLRSDLTVVERADAGIVLARLGDQRREVMTIEGMQFCHVPAGPFWMGSGEEDKDAWDDEKPKHSLTLPAYWISRYPVTNAQFAEFVQAEGYTVARYWTDAETAGYWKEDRGFQGPWDDEPRLRPTEFGEPFVLPNHPVVGVSWYEALAFCRWLAEQVGHDMRLPSEAEWEKAARGGEEIPEPEHTFPCALGAGLTINDVTLRSNPGPRRVYPWEEAEITPERANYAQTGIGATSTVGCFPTGASPYGLEEMAGNVWEWTRSLWGTDWQKPDFVYPYGAADGREDLGAPEAARRVLRGGSWYISAGQRALRVPRPRRSAEPEQRYRFPGRGPRPLISEFSELCFTTRKQRRGALSRQSDAPWPPEAAGILKNGMVCL